MYGWPKGLDSPQLVGRRVQSVTFAENVIVIAFSDALTVSISGPLSYRVSADDEPRREQAPASHSALVGVVGRTVRAVELRSPQEVDLTLDQEFTITLLDESTTYESYLISLGGRDIAV